ncbi:hypothetical protein CTEN210_13417 [Chaetoceros tenuissimus]|uniref:Uncharacterized protein n=1 Tax=Chaetoceros tenuissimus TaxID=426638 RepID=A0AAD3HB78_9STRA|nr:hypothetical protein CTEN210_13417 [Chaetoceros tenuissimus]
MADTLRRIEDWVFSWCTSLVFIKFLRNLEFIGTFVFSNCTSLTSIFIPPSCREIGYIPFTYCRKLLIFQVPQHTSLGYLALDTCAALFKASPFGPVPPHEIETGYTDEVTAWIKNVHGDDEEYALHRACCSFNPMTDIIYEIVKKQGLKSFKKPNGIGITPLRYLEENPFADIDQSAVVKRYVLDLMGIEYNMRE